VVAVAAYDGSTSKRRRSPRAREQAAASSFKHEKLLFKSRGFKAKGKKKKKKKKKAKKKKKKSKKARKEGRNPSCRTSSASSSADKFDLSFAEMIRTIVSRSSGGHKFEISSREAVLFQSA
jgi:hypothetical protein